MQTRVYKAGSIVYFTGDTSDRVYILKQGQAQSIFLSEETGYETRELINIGEFFGVKSILGTYPQEDTVQCLTDCVVIIITYEEFESLIAKNKPIIIKMLKVFSNQLRRINKRVRELVENDINDEAPDPLEGLYNIGEFYFKNKKYKNALYAYKRYLQYADEDSTYYNTVKEKIEECKDELDITDDSDIAPPNSEVSSAEKTAAQAQTAVNDPVYNKAVELYNSNNYVNSIKTFNTLLKSSNAAVAENSMFYMGKCYYNLNKYDNASTVLLSAIKKYPKSSNVKEAILFLAKTCEAKGDKTKAKAYYQKVISMPPMDNFSKEANASVSRL
ncbi:cyclic nucleotide-binding domain-containing protein [Brachyspira murdochii]|uniref:Putative transcriptional regulator, Crp/Fnr family n=1 Tax=Brachyspira murdochii (strain ATCC 51284 / DSM 12563 / 56-150) TaxID=526224 RepID=D5U4G2_BRAM5|nr:tetratricopeptide repeat protein [Brachyspira murdochii]ADG70207.1 putative transcriptional regulator, Crp/Fnr family [Brachyspira murdochii DSM 12563]